MAAHIICYEKVTETLGRITSTQTVMDEVYSAHMLDAQGVLFKVVPIDGFAGYVTIDGDHVDFAERPEIGAAWTKTLLAPMETTVLPMVPACTVNVYGPVSGPVEHGGGDLAISFVLPGEYTVMFEAFPFKAITQKFIVAYKR